ncbi:MAG: hypothetical protein CUN53_10350 [Phototrophicales bacterium]|nr:MAG: hypothetical protein CUN53_10350 [Phototrophicales bacterium]
MPHCYRCDTIVEPRLSEQWFVKIQPLAEKAIQAVRDGRIKIVPDRFEKVYYHWLENIQDWCVSRQLWWGHRIPAWYAEDGEIYVGRTPPSDGRVWTPEEDVLDTWFSSGLWPFSTLGWPQETPDFKRFYPTSILETGYDILFFWVARMIMLGLWFTDNVPFHTVYLHGLVRDKYGRKISKTLGNVIDPRELIDQYGTDPLRFTLATGSTPGNDVNLDPVRVERNWRFVNKVWQMSSFVIQNLDGSPAGEIPPVESLDLPSRWILSRLNSLIASVHRLFASHQYGEAGRQIDDFLYSEFADWYIEISKQPLYQGNEEEKARTRSVLYHVLDCSLRLLHPFMPFVTEEIWRHLPRVDDRPLIISRYPTADAQYLDEEAERQMLALIDLIRGVRNVRDQYNVEPARKITAFLQANPDLRNLIERYSYLFSRLCNVVSIVPLADGQSQPEGSAAVIAGDLTIYLPLADFIDKAAECERLNRERSKLSEQIARSQGMLNNKGFIQRARPDVIEREREKLATLLASQAQLDERIGALCS